MARTRRALRWIVALVVVAVSTATAWWWFGREPPLRYVTARITRGDIQRTVSMTGALNPVVTAQVESYVSGNIKSWSCDYNTIVKVGQVCATIDPLPFQVVVDQDTASLHSGMAQLAKDRVAVANQAVVYAYDEKLIGEGIVSQETINADKATLDQQRAQVNLDLATVAAQQAALHGAEVNLGYTKIVSPVNGMVITRYIDVGQTVVSSLSAAPLFLIGKDMHWMQVDTNVSEADVGGVKAGQKAYFTVQAHQGRTFWGTVRQVREGPITVQNVVTYDVVVDVKNDDLALFPGMTADAHIITAERKDVLRVPLPAIRFNPGGIEHRRDGAGAADAGGGVGRNSAEGNAAAGGARRGGTGGPEERDNSMANPGARRFGGRGGPGTTRARLWLLRDGKLVAVRVRTGLDDGALIEVSGEDLKPGDVVVVNAVRPNEERSQPTNRQGGNNLGGSNVNPRGQGAGGGFRP